MYVEPSGEIASPAFGGYTASSTRAEVMGEIHVQMIKYASEDIVNPYIQANEYIYMVH